VKVKIGTVNALDFQHVTVTLFLFKPKTLDSAGKIKDRVTLRKKGKVVDFTLPFKKLGAFYLHLVDIQKNH